MALKKPGAPAAAAGKFEDSTGTTTVTAERPIIPTAQPETASPSPATPQAEARAAQSASTAVAKAQRGSLDVTRKLETLFAGHENALPQVDFGVLPRLVGTNGNVQDKSESKLLGETIVIELVSWNLEFVVSPGSDKDEAKELVRYSRDGKVIDETGEQVDAYLEKLRTVEGYSDAAVKKYIQLVGIVESTAKDTGNYLVGSMVQVSLSPQSAKLFEGYRLQESVKLRLNPALQEKVDNRLKITAEVKTNGPNTYTLLKVSSAPVAA